MTYPRTCCICGNPVLVSRHDQPNTEIRFHHDDRTGVAVSWHVVCEQPGWPHLK
jgi:hypothetical protein